MVPSVECGGILLFEEDKVNINKLPKEPELKAPLSLDYPSNEIEVTTP